MTNKLKQIAIEDKKIAKRSTRYDKFFGLGKNYGRNW